MRFAAIALILLIFPGCTKNGAAGPGQVPVSRGTQLAQSTLIADGHIDLPEQLFLHSADVSQPVQDGEFDYPRAMAGGLNLAFLAVYVPASVANAGAGKQRANTLIDIVNNIATAHPNQFAMALSSAQVSANMATNRVSLAMGLEDGAAIGNDLTNVQYFYDRGIRYITLATSRSNQLADSSYDSNRPWQGLSPFGKQVVQEMNRLGIMVDVSHLSDKAFYDVIATSQTPVIASHSAARHFTPGFERNMSDDMLKALEANGGVIALIAGSAYLDTTSWQDAIKRNQLVSDYFSQHNIDPNSTQAESVRKEIYAENPFEYATIDDMLNEIDYLVALIGVDHVGIGTAFDGVGNTLPSGFKDVASYPNLVDGLIARGYTDEDIRKIMGANLMRVWRTVEAHAQQAGA